MGTSKAWLPFGGEPLLSRIVRTVCDVLEPVIIVAAADQLLPAVDKKAIIVRDCVPENGPLEGLRAGFRALVGLARTAFVCTTDAPFIAPELIDVLCNRLRDSDCDAVIPMVLGMPQPLAAMYRVHVLEAIEQLLKSGERSLKALTRKIQLMTITEAELLQDQKLLRADPNLLSFRNLNTRQEYEAALAILR